MWPYYQSNSYRQRNHWVTWTSCLGGLNLSVCIYEMVTIAVRMSQAAVKTTQINPTEPWTVGTQMHSLDVAKISDPCRAGSIILH